ncbi:hypothetical protein I79_006856 [Cricetulus griseus]|uniref:Uncharacterized protein n=1 Tax=Cricetulus griseus TaxID=10029 RepID=G3H8W9_CRIGR|nr:hypothetical protein I79_006856 [Cricetulus griseus]
MSVSSPGHPPSSFLGLALRIFSASDLVLPLYHQEKSGLDPAMSYIHMQFKRCQ